MIHKVKTVTWEVRSHRQETILSDKGIMISSDWEDCCLIGEWGKPNIKRMIWHLQDVLKVLNKLEKERQARKEKQINEDLPEEK